MWEYMYLAVGLFLLIFLILLGKTLVPLYRRRMNWKNKLGEATRKYERIRQLREDLLVI